MKNIFLALIKKKQFFIFLTIVLISSSCEEKEKLEVLPVLETLPITHSSVFQSLGYNWHLRLTVQEKGNIPVAEYGITYSTYRVNEIYAADAIRIPTAENGIKYRFSEEFGFGKKELTLHDLYYGTKTYVYQRAYAKLSDGRIIYGDIVLTEAGKIIDPETPFIR